MEHRKRDRAAVPLTLPAVMGTFPRSLGARAPLRSGAQRTACTRATRARFAPCRGFAHSTTLLSSEAQYEAAAMEADHIAHRLCEWGTRNYRRSNLAVALFAAILVAISNVYTHTVTSETSWEEVYQTVKHCVNTPLRTSCTRLVRNRNPS